MSAREELTKSALIIGFELWKRVVEAPGEDSVAELLLEAALKVPRASFACLARKDERGEPEITRHSGTDAPTTAETEECLVAARAALERHRERSTWPNDSGTNDGPPPDTNEEVPLWTVAKVLAERERVLAILIIMRRGSLPFDPLERRAFTILTHHAAYGLIRRASARASTKPSRARDDEKPVATGDRKHDDEVKRVKTRRVDRSELARIRDGVKEIVGRGAEHARLVETIARFAPTELPVLILGESGTGKELIANALHRLSSRRGGPVVAVNAGALPEELIEAELFGHAKGAFTGAVSASAGIMRAAAGGTLFLDELGELPLAAQVKLLRVLQARKVRPVGETQEVDVDFRLVAATNRPLHEMAASGEFREDLYYRVRSLTISVPPLRERREDLPALVEHFLSVHGGARAPKLSREAWKRIEEHAWPGNVRELRAAIERALAFGRDPVPAADLGLDAPGVASSLDEAEEARRARYRRVHDEVKSIAHAARILGVHRNTVARVLGLWGKPTDEPGAD